MNNLEDESTYLLTAYYIADYYGYDTQSSQLIEEMAELIQAVSKYSRLRRGQPLSEPLTEKAARENIIDGIADVEVMLAQLKYLVNIGDSEVDRVKAEKVYRTLGKIKGCNK